jgi:hypothetical protein
MTVHPEWIFMAYPGLLQHPNPIAGPVPKHGSNRAQTTRHRRPSSASAGLCPAGIVCRTTAFAGANLEFILEIELMSAMLMQARSTYGEGVSGGAAVGES